MNTSSDNKLEKPSIIQALISGFNTVANKPYVMIPPIILDLFLWFGPAWRVDAFFMPLIQSLTKLPGLDSIEYRNILEEYITIWQEIVTNFNLAVTLRTLPVGIPSLMVSKTPFLNPIGQPLVFNLNTNFEILGFWITFMLIGFFFANIYFQYISKQIIELNNDNNLKSIMRTFYQIILMPVLMVFILIILTIPLVFLITLVTLISPTIAQFILLTAGVIVLWIVMPLVFTPHGIFLYKQNLISAMMTSISVVRVSMAQTAWFILLSFVMIEGLDYLWRAPAVDNWMLLVGILGHAFVVSAVIAASFHYFIDATNFTQSVMNKKMKSI